MISYIRLVSIAILVFLVACSSAPSQEAKVSAANDSFVQREFNPTVDGNWIGNGVSYGAYRDGEGPGKGLTSKQNILEDLQIISTRWNLIRLYGSDQQSQNILEVIADNNLPIRVMQGIWLDGHKTEDENTAQLKQAIELANRFPEIIVAVNVGNEIFVDWSYHRLEDMDKVIGQIRQIRANIVQPVTVSDDYNFWNKPQAKKIAEEIDFICLHAYAFWNNKTLDVAMDWTDSIYRDIQRRHPGHRVAYCETGWPTSRVYNDGSYEGGLIGKAGENEQQVFFDQYHHWVESNQVISFYFSSFDELWKGGFDGENPMAKAEKHWGLYNSDRSPKKAVR
jgi:exo-beta-1,3-glucanase (GH17 family)